MELKDLHNLPNNGGGGSHMGVALPLLSLFLSLFSSVQELDLFLSVVIKCTSVATFVIYVTINFPAIKKQLKEWFTKKDKDGQ